MGIPGLFGREKKFSGGLRENRPSPPFPALFLTIPAACGKSRNLFRYWSVGKIQGWGDGEDNGQSD